MPPRDPWRAPKNNKWIAVGKKIVPLPAGRVMGGSETGKEYKSPAHAPVFIITKIEVTPNQTRMIHLCLEVDPTTTTARWEMDIKAKWVPAPAPPKPPRPKKERKSRFDREEPV